MVENDELERLRSVKNLYEADLMQKANVVGVGIGLRQRAGELTDEPVIVVSVLQKEPAGNIDAKDVIPTELDGVPVDVQAVGRLKAF
ncbi:MAG: hypothetical protein AB8I69_21270 [Anaerolineae bacterium]